MGISGSYGGLNLGDEAILAGILGQLRAATEPLEITVFTRDPADTLRRHQVDRAVAVRSLAIDEVRPEVQRLDLLILGGGGILYDAHATTYLREVNLAHELGVPVMVYAVSAGPLKEQANQLAVREALDRCALVSVRERLAQQTLEQIGVRRPIHVTADPALLLEPEPVPRAALLAEGIDPSVRVVGVSVREPGPAAPDIDQNIYHQLLANVADFMVDRFDAEVIFVPMERNVLDVQHSHAVVAKMLRAQRAHVLKGEYGAAQLLGLMSHLDFAVGMRLHFLIFAALASVPFVALPYSTKVMGFLADIGIDAPPLELVNAGRLIAHIDDSWDHQRKRRGQIGRKLPRLQKRARQTGEMALALLRGEVIEPPRRRRTTRPPVLEASPATARASR